MSETRLSPMMVMEAISEKQISLKICLGDPDLLRSSICLPRLEEDIKFWTVAATLMHEFITSLGEVKKAYLQLQVTDNEKAEKEQEERSDVEG